MKALRPYQQKAVDDIARLYDRGVNKIVFQLATGGGKTIAASALIHRYLQSKKKNVLFVVHREELLKQFRRAVFEQHGITADPIMAGSRYRNPNHQVYVAMVETANNRLRKNPRWFGDVGMVIIDECHIGSFNKVHKYFDRDNILMVGLTATPLSSSKRNPLKKWYADIVCGADTPELVEQGALAPNKTYHIKNMDRGNIKVKNGEFDPASMFGEFSKGKHIKNCVAGYENHARGKKTLVFNCNIKHSELVNEAFLVAGHNSKHLDGATGKEERAAILDWFARTPGAVLQNVGVLTAGFDEPSAECVIMNRSTLSLPLWLQCTGRASRPYGGKGYFTIIDMGGNALDHGDWCSPRDWAHVFHNPPRPGDKGPPPPVKECVGCAAIIAASAFVCRFCGKEQPRPEVNYDKDSVELELFRNNVDMRGITIEAQKLGHSPYASLHNAKRLIVGRAKERQTGMNEKIAYALLGVFREKTKEWCKINGKPYNGWHKQISSKWFFEEVKSQFGWEQKPMTLNVEI